jgi:capsular polysaccharide biosynthesis protein
MWARPLGPAPAGPIDLEDDVNPVVDVHNPEERPYRGAITVGQEPGGIRTRVIDWNRSKFLQKCLELTKDKVYSENVYITRRDSKIRNVVNEVEIIAHLAKQGFKDYTLAELPFAEKVALFARAKRVICVSGAGLNNIMFSAKGCGVVDIFPPGMVHSQYYQLAKYLGLPYAFVIGSTDAPTSYEMQAGRNENVYIHPSQLDAALAELDEPKTVHG